MSGCREILCNVSQSICATEARREAASQSEPLCTGNGRRAFHTLKMQLCVGSLHNCARTG